jgi:GT2 family glycosyltransferase
MKPGFTAQLYLRDDAGYSEQRKVSASRIVADRCQLLRFEVPAGAKGLRLDPAEQPGFMHVQAMRLLRGGQLTWDWRSDTEGWRALAACPHHQMVLSASSALPAGLMLLCGDDPWVELPVASEALAGTVDLQLEVELGFAASADISPLSEAVHLALEGLALQTDHGRMLADQLAQAHRLHTQSSLEVRRLTREKAAVQRKLAELQGLPHSVQPIAATVDVIVPVYLNLEETRRCIEALLSCAVRTPWRLVVVNDASPEPDLTNWLRELAASDARVILFENLENLGYSGTVNRGIALSDDHDVVLLNSDAEVANDWLDRLRAAAYCDERVCSVTPFSNNATICSYPTLCEANALPPGWSVAELDRSFAVANPGQVLDVPTAVGFCMYIRRDCLREVGLFDPELFGKGYGEENDFCLRAADLGWRNLHALDIFVQHTGGVSFGTSKPQRELDAMVTLRQLYPDYERQVHEYIRLDPPAPARKRADLARASLRATSSHPRGIEVNPGMLQPLLKPFSARRKCWRKSASALKLAGQAQGSRPPSSSVAGATTPACRTRTF